MPARRSIAVVFARWGPYHLARLSSAAAVFEANGGELLAVEVAQSDKTYAWSLAESPGTFRRETLFQDRAYEDVPGREIGRALASLFDRERPSVVALPGWGFAEGRWGLWWCRTRRVPSVLMSESTAHDAARSWWKEAVKSLLVRQFDAALVGGSLHADYVARLGIPRARIFTGYDAVDNSYFAAGAARARADETTLRDRFRLPADYFLASSRFVEKKNLPGLLAAYDRYRRKRGGAAWHLVLLGDGPLRSVLEEEVRKRRLQDAVHMPGFIQYPDLPVYYGLARAFVHPSTVEQWGLVVNEAMAAGLAVLVSDRCGCAPDLVVEGQTGFVFHPGDADQLASLLETLSGGSVDLRAMGRAAAERVGRFSPEVFGVNLWRASMEACRRRGKDPDKSGTNP